jgi:Tfp pilus assembly protein PilX
MRRAKNKSKRILAELLKGQGGFSVLVVIFVMLVLTVIGYSMTRMMATKQKSVPVTAQSSSAFYVAEGGINWSGKYLSDLVS